MAETVQYRRNGLTDAAQFRNWCAHCRRPKVGCYCALIEPFESLPRFVILSQPREAKHRLGTGRMAHLGLGNSLWFEGVDFSEHSQVNREIADPGNAPMLLFPSRHAVNLSNITVTERQQLTACSRTPVVFVLDGTWKSVRKMMRLSDNLRRLPTICFKPLTPSAYGFRREPRPECYSTIEAIHHVIELFNDGDAAEARPRRHDRLLKAFHFMVARQLAYTPS
ncbi:MAG TPA: tRNA-uridine aminocarboxypropyltransferase [Candidatus Limnocylindria bacterium]|nr:tRNA-uridine aminocarboxypropyltransferase [Candidatus Limnocylindria bacterium]